ELTLEKNDKGNFNIQDIQDCLYLLKTEIVNHKCKGKVRIGVHGAASKMVDSSRKFNKEVDQIDWTITKCIEAVKKAERAGWGLVIDRHFSCGTKDTSIADLCIGLAMSQIKIGVSCVDDPCSICDRLGEIEKEVDEEYMES
ncbi:enolase, partial [Morus notabilis]|uniref:enolase n=1 Tax=Morus notabilis TaxID=981085 RepID=UPI000CED56D9